MSKLLDIKIEYHEHGKRNATIAILVAPIIGLIGHYFGVEIWSWIFFIEMLSFVVLLHSMMRIQTLKSIRGMSATDE